MEFYLIYLQYLSNVWPSKCIEYSASQLFGWFSLIFGHISQRVGYLESASSEISFKIMLSPYDLITLNMCHILRPTMYPKF